MDSVMAALDSYRILLSLIATLLVTAFVVNRYWEEVSFWWLRVLYNVPLIGKFSRLAKNEAYDDNSGWFKSETELCRDFVPHYENATEKDPVFFEKCQDYLRKVDEIGRNALPFWGWILLATMVFVEALGFSYVLAGYTIPGASENLQQKGALGIAFLISCLLVYLTHLTGHELHVNELIKKVRKWYNQDQGKVSLESDSKIDINNSYKDDNQPRWKQLYNRISAVTNADVAPSYKVSLLTGALVILVAIGATYVRGQVLEQMILTEHQVASGSNASYRDPYNEVATLPAELSAAQAKTDKQIEDSKEQAQRKGGWATFIVLAVIFVFLQIMGILLGMKTGFAGNDSRNARKFIAKFRSPEEFVRYYDQKRKFIANIAQKNLEKLQGVMVARSRQFSTDGGVKDRLSNRSKRDFLHLYAESCQGHCVTQKSYRTQLDVESDEVLSKAKEYNMNVEEYKILREEARLRAQKEKDSKESIPALSREQLLEKLTQEELDQLNGDSRAK